MIDRPEQPPRIYKNGRAKSSKELGLPKQCHHGQRASWCDICNQSHKGAIQMTTQEQRDALVSLLVKKLPVGIGNIITTVEQRQLCEQQIDLCLPVHIDMAIEVVKYKEINPNVSKHVTTQHYRNGWYHSQASAVQALSALKENTDE